MIKYPYTDFHEMNLDWVLENMKKLLSVYDELPETLQEYINNWFVTHPEYAVPDNSVTLAKINTDAKPFLENQYLTPEMFGATGDGITDDSTAFKEACDEAIRTGNTVYCFAKYRISDDITMDADSNKLNIMCFGDIIPYGHIVFKNVVNSDVTIKLLGGGTGNLSDAAVSFYGCGYTKFHLTAKNVNCLAFQMGGDIADGGPNFFCNVSVEGWYNLCTLHHGKSTGTRQYAFGTYDHIYDYQSSYGIRFERSHDITILHIENLYIDETHTRNSVEFVDCHMVNVVSLAIGGKAQYLGYINNSRIHIGYAFINSEDQDTRVTQGLFITGASRANIDYVASGFLDYAVIPNNIINPTGSTWHGAVYVKDGYTYNPNTDHLMKFDETTSLRVACGTELNTNITTPDATNFTYVSGGWSKVGGEVFINIKYKLNNAISGLSSLKVMFNGVPGDVDAGWEIYDIQKNSTNNPTNLYVSGGSIYLPPYGSLANPGDHYIVGRYFTKTD